VTLAAASGAAAGTTDTLPSGVFFVDVGYVHAVTDKQYDGQRREIALLEPIERYEAGAGLQGVLRARPRVDMRMLVSQLLYGITDRWTVGLAVPTAIETTIRPNLGWTPGDYNSTLGRPYSEQDFWEWAASMGQGKPAPVWRGNAWTLADIVLASRLRLPEPGWMKRHALRWSLLVQGALPTGREVDPEELIDLGTQGWYLHNFGDLEVHLALDWRLRDGAGVERLTVGTEVWYAWLRTRTLRAATGKKNPLLLNVAPYVGETFEVDGGDWQAARLSVDVVPLIGPTFGTWMTRGSVEAASRFPPLLTLTVSYDYIHLMPTVWRSNYAVWSLDQGRTWGWGDKHAFSATATVSLLRVGAPLQLYVRQRSLDVLPGRNMRPANATTYGVRLIAKFW
jgi:hypothetical protein